MALLIGARLGPYEVVAPLGAGGMGEVYRARDTRLSRDVALKVLPEFVATDPERLKRFEREARAASAIDHPNVLVVHDVGTENGVPYVVTEKSRPIPGLRPEDTPMRWSGDGRHLFVHARRPGFPVAIDRLDIRSGRRERWRELPVPDAAGMADIGAGAILLTPDGRTALYHGFRNLADLYLVDGLR